jgi:molybdopterin converting factor small subunit
MDNHKVIVKDDEIDLLSLFSSLFTLIKKNIYILVAIIVISMSIGYIFYKRANPYFKAQMIADSSILPNTEIVNIIDYWQTLINKGDYVTLAGKLNLSLESASHMSEIKAEDTQPGSTDPTKSKNENSFMISVVVSDVKVLDSLENGIVNALENNEYVKRRSTIRRQNLESLKTKIIAEIVALDSVKTSVKGLLNNGRSASGTFLTSPSEVNLQIVSLYERILDLETSLKLGDDIQIIAHFTKTTKPDGPKVKSYIIYGFVVGCLLSILLLAWKLINSKLKAYSASKVYNA